MEVSFSICTEELMEEMDLDNTVETLVSDAVSDEILNYDIPDWCDIHEAINEGMVEYAEAMKFITAEDLEDGDYIRLGDRYFEGMRTDVAVLANDLEIARRSIRVLLEERERTLGRRARRLFTLTSSLLAKVSRRVHWHMPRR